MSPPWSFTRLMWYEECPYRMALDRQGLGRRRALTAGPHDKTEAQQRGIDAHEALEKFFLGEQDELPSMLIGTPWESLCHEWRELGAVPEAALYVDKEGRPVETKREAFKQGRLDLLVEMSGTLMVIDFKTGSRASGGLKDIQEVQWFMTLVAAHFPDAERLLGGPAYFKEKEPRVREFSREQVQFLARRFDARIARLEELGDHAKPACLGYVCARCRYNRAAMGENGCPYDVTP